VAQTLPRYILAGSPDSARRVRQALQELEPLTEVSSAAAVLDDGELEPGWLFMTSDLPTGEVESLILGLGKRGGSWSPVALEERHGEIRAVPVSPGFARPLNETVGKVRSGGTEASLLSFRYALGVLSKIRHDVNNPLTAALAETQLLMMDTEEGTEASQSLRMVEHQLHRIRDLIALLNALRPPRD
jgi:signal transduction histidine kinase